MSFPPYNASVLSQYGSIFRFIAPQVVGGLVRPASPLFLPPTCHRQDHGGNPSTMPVPMGNVLVRCRLYGSVYLVQHGKQQATLTLHQFVCAITAIILLILRSFQRKGLCNSGLKAKSTTFVRNITTIRLRSQFVTLKIKIEIWQII